MGRQQQPVQVARVAQVLKGAWAAVFRAVAIAVLETTQEYRIVCLDPIIADIIRVSQCPFQVVLN
jgi:hypothetical protein